MARRRSSRIWLIFAAVAGVLVLLGAVALYLLNPRLTSYLESDAFRAEMEKETAKGLHFPSGTFAPIRRTGFLSAATESFRADGGEKALTKLDAHGISARFNPLGVFLRRWQLDELHLDGGEVGIHVYQPKPEPKPSKPWYHIFLPDRVYLKRIWSEPADVTWRLQDRKSGIFGTRLLITPHGRDFNYQGDGGVMRLPHAPDLQMRQVRMLITKTLFELDNLDLSLGNGTIHGEGKAGMRDDKRVDFTVAFDKLPVRDWAPESWQKNIAGIGFGKACWTGKDQTLANAEVEGSLRIEGGRLRGLAFLDQLAAITKQPSLETLEFQKCSAEVEWRKNVGQVKNIEVETKGKFRIEGAVSLSKDSLGGALRLGATPDYLEWLPNAREVFREEHDGYLWTTVHLSGTLDDPQQDLSPRILEALKDSPGAFFSALLRVLGAWLR